MKKKSIHKDLLTLIPLICSGVLCIVLIVLLWNKLDNDPEFIKQLAKFTIYFISINGFISTILLLYLLANGVNLAENRNNSIEHNKVSQKMSNFQEIIELLLQSDIWASGLKEYIDDEFEGLTFFEVKEFYKGKSKLAIEFLQEDQNFLETENLYLELKSLMMVNPKDKKTIARPNSGRAYGREIVEKWFLHKCGSGLWYYFGYNFGAFKKALDLSKIPDNHAERIVLLAVQIDKDVFEDSSFNEIFLAKLGDYMNKMVIPNLYQIVDSSASNTSPLTRYLKTIFILFASFGVILPLAFHIFKLPTQVIAICLGIIIGVLFYIATSFYQFLDGDNDS
ncbi:hypothetical protein [Ulvibacter antarcticus]|nr:hypothetical protein [Ulvibacter antarcticus]